jgi:Tol biopolymer transport system component
LMLIEANGSQRRSVLPCPSSTCSDNVPWAWSPDGTKIYFSGERRSGHAIWSVAADGSGLRRIASYGALLTGVSVSPGGEELAIATGRWGAPVIRIVDTSDGSLVREVIPGELELVTGISWSPSGESLAIGGRLSREEASIFTITRTDGDMRRVTNCEAGCQDVNPSWSPDGRWITFVRGDEFQSDVYVTSADGQTMYRVTDGPERECCVAWASR